MKRQLVHLALALLILVISPAAAQHNATTIYLPAVTTGAEPVRIVIDPLVKPSRETLPGLGGGPPRPVGAFVQEDGTQVEFVANEVRLKPRDAADLQHFLAAYGGTVIHDGSVPRVPDMEARYRSGEPPAGRYLIRIDPQRVSAAKVVATMQQAGAGGEHRFSSEGALKLIALVTGERSWQISPNFVLRSNAVLEHPNGPNKFLDASFWPWMNEDSDPTTPGDQGLSVGVVHAWEYLQYHNLPPSGNAVWQPPVVAIVDGGFALDTTNGVPLNDNIDFVSFGPKPYQYDAADNDPFAGGTNPGQCAVSCPWHGQHAFGVAAAQANNRYGSAGTAGTVAVPVLIRVDDSSDVIERGIKIAVASGADVVSISMSFACPVVTWICKIPWDDPWEDMRSAVAYARSHNAIIVAAAGNDGNAYYDDKVIPCALSGVICVGAVDRDKKAASYSNWGPVVDIWAPTDIYTTPDPTTAGEDGVQALPFFSGTSASTPFVAGVVTMMRTLNPELTASQALAILRYTANSSPDARVVDGYIDAYRAVVETKENQPPAVTFIAPGQGERVPWPAGAASFRVALTDPETPNRFTGQIIISSDRLGQLCTASSSGNTSELGCSGPELSLGTHLITARAIDAHGAQASTTRMIEVVNSPPTTTITYPANGSVFYTSQRINFRGYAEDHDELIPDPSLVWTTKELGVIGKGREIDVQLPAGNHVVQLATLDSHGALGTSTVEIVVRVGEGVPTAKITAPQAGALISPGTPISFVGEANDPEEGALSGDQLRWYSDIDGFLGTGTNLTKALSGPDEPCNPEAIMHVITLEATDSDGHRTTHQIHINSGTIC